MGPHTTRSSPGLLLCREARSRGFCCLARRLCSFGFGVFPSASECAQRVQCVFQSFLFFGGPVTVEEFPFSGQGGSFRFGHPLEDNAVVSFKNGGSVESLPICMAGAWGKCGRHNQLQTDSIRILRDLDQYATSSHNGQVHFTHQCDAFKVTQKITLRREGKRLRARAEAFCSSRRDVSPNPPVGFFMVPRNVR